MRIDELIWDDWNIKHIARHDVSEQEVEQVCEPGQHLARRATKTDYGLTRYRVYGQSYSGRYLFIVLDRVRNHKFYVVTARDMTEREKQAFKRQRK